MARASLWQSLGESFEVSAEAVNRRFAKTRPSTSYKQVDCDARYLVKASFDTLENFRKLQKAPSGAGTHSWRAVEVSATGHAGVSSSKKGCDQIDHIREAAARKGALRAA